MTDKNPKKKVDWFFIIPIILITTVGMLTGYNITYTALAGVVGVLLGYGLKKIFKKK